MVKIVRCVCSKKAKQMEKHLKNDYRKFREYAEGRGDHEKFDVVFDAGYVYGSLQMFEGAGCSLTPTLRKYRKAMQSALKKAEG